MSGYTIIWKYYHCTKQNAVCYEVLLWYMLIRSMYATNFWKLSQDVCLFGSLRLTLSSTRRISGLQSLAKMSRYLFLPSLFTTLYKRCFVRKALGWRHKTLRLLYTESWLRCFLTFLHPNRDFYFGVVKSGLVW